jgi:hypothetical protein
MRRPAVLLALALGGAAVVGGCGDGATDGPGDTVTGRVMSITAQRYCVSVDRGATRTCVDIPDSRAVEGVEVGECVTTTRDLTSEGSRVEVVPEAACAAGDLGD